MRYAIVLLVGVLIGAIVTVTALNILGGGAAFHKGVMAVMSYHAGALREQVAEERCEASTPHFTTLRALANDLEPAFLPTGGDDALFARYAGQFRDRLDLALATPAADCKTLGEQLAQVGDGCKACHRDFK